MNQKIIEYKKYIRIYEIRKRKAKKSATRFRRGTLLQPRT